MSAALLGLALWAAVGTLGTPLRQDGYSFRPPQGFRMARMDLYHATKVGAVGPRGSSRYLSAALTDGSGEGAASLLIALVEGTFAATPSSRDEFATWTAVHFREELGVPLALERAALVSGATPRVEVLGTIREHGQVRHVLVSAFEGQGRYAVVTFSVPSGRAEALLPSLEQSLATFRMESPGKALPRSVAGIAAMTSVAALLLSWVLWRRRRRQERPAPGD